jgi:hypothetical protein
LADGKITINGVLTDTDFVATQQIAYSTILTATNGYMYPFENTRSLPKKNTGIIFAAQLVTKNTDGNTYSPLALVKWLSNYYTPGAAKTAIAKYLNTDYATSAYTDDKTAQTSITAENIEFVSNGDDFHAKIAFASGVSIYKRGEGGTSAIVDATDNKALTAVIEALPNIQYWNQGKCYYFAKITHLPGTAIEKAGVVRNHWYQMTVNNVYGLGTPVADPEQAVTPVKPTEDEWYISTSINVLAWKRSYQGVDLTTD